MKKKITSFLLALVMVLGMLPATGGVEVAEAAALTQSQFEEKLSSAKAMYPTGSQKEEWSINGTVVGWECHGYGRWLSWHVWGVDFANGNGTGWTLLKSSSSSSYIDSLVPGDVVRYRYVNSSGTAKAFDHTIFVTKIVGDTIYYTDCNSDNQCTIKWDQQVSKSALDNKLKYQLYSAGDGSYGYIAHYTPNTLSSGSSGNGSSNSIISKTYPSYCQIKATADTTIMTQPCSNGTDASSTKIESVSKNKTLTAYELVLNKVGNLWYKVKASDGTVGYIPSAKVSWVKDYTSDIKITGATNPPDQEVGDAHWIQGTVSATYSGLTDVSVYVYAGTATSGTAKIGAKGSVSGNSYSLYKSYVDNNTLFNKLTEGSYTFVVRGYYKNYYAADEKTAGYHTGEVIVQQSHFRVVEDNVLDYLPSKPSFVDTKSAYTADEQVVLKWNATTNTTHYNIWLGKKQGDGSWVSTHITFIKDTQYSAALAAGEYRAWLQAYNSNEWWPDGNDWLYTEADDYVYFTVKPSVPTLSISTTKSCGNPKLTWTAVTGAEEYVVYRRPADVETYSELARTTSLNYTDKSSDRVLGTKYYYKVRAIADDVYSDKSGNVKHTYAHTEVTDKAVAATCTTAGKTEGKHCSDCGTVTVAQKTVAAKGHTEVTVSGKSATCTATGLTDGKKCSTCGAVTVAQKTIAAKGHSFSNGTCTVCGAKDPNYIAPLTGVTRIYGADRYETAFKTAEVLKQQLGVEKFDSIVVACGDKFADALGGSYLAAKKNAPILLVKSSKIDAVKDYIKANLNPGGTVYLLGGTAAIPAAMDKGLDGFNVKRLAGATRYDTNLLILQEAGVTNEDILICTGKNFADSLSAAAAGRPILLVKDSLNDSQKAFLQSHAANKKYILGGTAAVSTSVENQVKAYGTVERIGGNTRYETSVLIAKEFFPDATQAALAYAQNFPDGLSGGALAYAMKAPLVLTASGKESAAAAYAKEQGITSGVIFGGSGLISDKTVRTIFQMKSSDIIKIG